MGNTPPEALWRIYGFDLSDRYPVVLSLQLHLRDMHMVSFHQREGVQRVLNRPGVEKSMLTAYFEMNRIYEIARGILYRDYPEFYTWQSLGKFWQKRVRRDTLRQIGRIVSANPADGGALLSEGSREPRSRCNLV